MPRFDFLSNIPLVGTATSRVVRSSSRFKAGYLSWREVSLASGTIPVHTLSTPYTPPWSAVEAIDSLNPPRFMSSTGDSAPSSGSISPNSPSTPRPSSSIILISPTNEVLLLHRVKTATSFPSAHVFPGGNLSPGQDGQVPDVNDPLRHEDGPAYRLGAIRECFEESGILLARSKESGVHGLLQVEGSVREEGRKAVHCGKVRFTDWLEQLGGVADTENLIPFTRWITPPNISRRFTTQMYIYLLPLATANDTPSSSMNSLAEGEGAVIPIPTPDGGLEHTAARFLHPWEWRFLAGAHEIVLFPPQYFLLHLLSHIFPLHNAHKGQEELERQRGALMEFLKTSDPPWGEKCICPISLRGKLDDGSTVLSLEKAGPELDGTGRRGDLEQVMSVKVGKEGPRDVKVCWKELKREMKPKGNL